MTKSMGKEYAETGITINALAPAVIHTAMVEAMPEAQVAYMTDKIPMKRCGTLEEFATMAEFIVSPVNNFATGFTFDLRVVGPLPMRETRLRTSICTPT